MKLGRFVVEGLDGPVHRICLVLPEQGRVIDLRAAEALRLQTQGATREASLRLASALFPESMSAAIALGQQFLDSAAQAAEKRGDDASLAIDVIKWGAACDPSVVRDGLTFTKHIRQFHERMNVTPQPALLDIPGYFKGSPWTVIGNDAVVPWPAKGQRIDYELEIGWVIGKLANNVSPDDALSHLFGVTIFNDFSARDLQANEFAIGMGPTKSKDFAYGIGPWITTIDEFKSLNNIAMSVRVNGETWGEGDTSEMLWTPEELIAYVSIDDHIQPGDVIGSGTMGNGSALEIGRSLNPGDLVELEVAGVGVLRNRIGEKKADGWWPEKRQPFM
ncbi:fumarylacetoacetate hydrolase family protein [Pseudomonas sp. Irchel s3f7]|jgi:2-keto-4-pentenoate hydratase/2-oxohepta-3-ene-1,7-dioic acid hydratase in catechol pathway|uniref:fumarylacetoacetate hydrolase family protein n=1 Tax=Pseudomonas sp. Irchel s3f7 TaxID=2009153 RepID=UPI000BA47A94|nr:fumarylacetoacetate hydrolase family protein [Pseudomonas sp. Irchel s3f7]